MCKKKQTKKYFVEKIEAIHTDDNTLDIIFMKRKPTKTNSYLFFFPETIEEDAGNVYIDDVEYLLPKSTNNVGTSRTGSFFCFETNILENFQFYIN